MALARKSMWIIAFCLLVATLVGYLWLNSHRCGFRDCLWSETMLTVAKKQVQVEGQLAAGKRIALNTFVSEMPAATQHYVRYAFVLSSGAIVVAGDTDSKPFFVAFEPVRHGQQINWQCAGNPAWLFDLKTVNNIGDCGERLRKLASTGGAGAS